MGLPATPADGGAEVLKYYHLCIRRANLRMGIVPVVNEWFR
jgi:hypothetical protein